MNRNPQHWNQNPNWQQNPHYSQQQYHDPETQQLKHHTLHTLEPWIQYGLQEAKFTSYSHAMLEVAAISYLIGRGYNPRVAHQIVESWEVNESF
ncbi:hypothetical protein [Pseudalkalibacillus decolorationis]|uniref:hypothetical protein n=1 Tax=Pseudalkalibacillus decolorationis TaxID=163879 RepID=UPI00214740A2|nr:hypothetical protein [Pseudalkalibacillus decolorationis]